MKKVKLGIVGLGKLGLHHAHNIQFRIPNAELTAGCSIVQSEIDYIKNSWDIQYGYTNYTQMLKHDELDGIVIASSANAHYDHVIAALEAGFNVFVEKPLAVNMQQIEEIEQVYLEHQKQIFQLGFMRRYDNAFAEAKKKIDEGFIGEPIIVKCHGLDPASAKEALLKHIPNSGGIFLDLSIHDFDLARWYLNAEAKSVYALGGVYAFEEFKALNDLDNASISMEFEGGKMGLFHTSRNATHGYHIETQIFGTEGSISVSNVPEKNQLTLFDKKGAVRECPQWFWERFEQAYLNEIQEFATCILENKKPVVSLIDGKKATEIAYAAQKSFELKEVIKL